MNALAKPVLPVMVTLCLVSPSMAQGVVEQVKSYSPSVSFKPVMMPVAISMDAEGNIKYEITGTVSTPAGEITFSGSEPKPKLSPGPGFAKLSEYVKKEGERARRAEETSTYSKVYNSRSEIEAILNPKPQEVLARKVAALEEENRQLRAKLLIHEPAGQSPVKATTDPAVKDGSTRIRPLSELLKATEKKP